MSVIGLTVEYRIGSESGPDSLQRMGVAFERAGAEVADFGKHVFPLLSPIFEAAETRQFDAQGGGPVAGSWAELSAVYADWKEQHYPGQPLLVALLVLLAHESALGPAPVDVLGGGDRLEGD